MNTTKKKENIRIYGAGGHSQVIRAVLEENGYHVTEVFDDKPSGKHHASKNVVPGARDHLANFAHEGPPVIIAIGNNLERAEIAALLKCEYERAIHPSAIISKSSKIGKGTVVFAGAIVQPNTHIGEHVIINTGASVDHDNIIGDFAHISPKAALCGHVEVGEGSHIGVGALVIPKVKIGKWCTIGAGTVVLKDIPDFCTVVGNPGKIIKTKRPHITAPQQGQDLFDIAFIGSGISASFTLINFLENIKNSKVPSPIRIAVIEKYGEFFSGIPYGSRSGSSSLLITSLKDFLPEPEYGKFTEWLTDNKGWLFDEFKKDGGKLSENWLEENKSNIENNAWGDLFVPRRFFGRYVNEKVSRKIEHARINGLATLETLTMNVQDIIKRADGYTITENNKSLNAKKVVLAIGSPPPKTIWPTPPLKTTVKKDLLLIANPYEPGLNETLKSIHAFLKNRTGKQTNVLIVGANASALELLFKMNDHQYLADEIDNFFFISTLGIVPDSMVNYELSKKFRPEHLLSLKKKNKLTADEIAGAAYADLDKAEAMHIGAATTVSPISLAFSELLPALNEQELQKFACYVGNEIGRRQRCAGVHYSEVIDRLIEKKAFDHIVGRFVNMEKRDDHYKLRYLKTATKKEELYNEPIHIVINCIGSETLDNREHIPNLYTNLVASDLCTPNNSQRGFQVNHNLETQSNFYVVGPLLAGNVIDHKAVWHVEHCGRILWLSQLLADKMAKSMFMDHMPFAKSDNSQPSVKANPTIKKANDLNLAVKVDKADKCEVISTKKEWDTLLQEIGQYDFYHTYDYHDLSKTEIEIPILLKYTEDNFTIALPLLVRNIENTPYKDATSVYGYPGPIAKGISKNFNNKKFIEALKNYFKEEKIISVFSRLHPYLSYQKGILKDFGTIVQQGKVVNIDLSLEPEIQRQNYQSRLKTYINKSRRNCSVINGTTDKDLHNFIEIYHENMGRVNAKKSYYFSTQYFKKLVTSADFESEVLLAIDKETGKVIAGCIFIITNSIVQYHLSGCKVNYLHLTPTKLLIDEMRLRANEKGCRIFNLGGGLSGLDTDSLFRFKSMFSKDHRSFNLWKLIVDKEVYSHLANKNHNLGNENFFPSYRSDE